MGRRKRLLKERQSLKRHNSFMRYYKESSKEELKKVMDDMLSFFVSLTKAIEMDESEIKEAIDIFISTNIAQDNDMSNQEKQFSEEMIQYCTDYLKNNLKSNLQNT